MDFLGREKGRTMSVSTGRSVVLSFRQRMDKVSSRLGTDDDVSCCIYGTGRGDPHDRKGRVILSPR